MGKGWGRGYGARVLASKRPGEKSIDRPRPRTWWGRNWFWVAPAGCLTALAGVVGFVALVLTLLFGAVRSSTPFRHALARAQADPIVRGSLGSPIRDGLFPSGAFRSGAGGGSARLAIPLEGSRGRGTLYVVASQAEGRWRYTTLVVRLESSGNRIDLLQSTI